MFLGGVAQIEDVNPDTPFAKALSALFRNDIGRLMIVEDGKLLGIITRSDIMKGFRLQKLQQDMELKKREAYSCFLIELTASCP